MTEQQAISAAAILNAAGMYDAAEEMERRAEFLRKEYFQARAQQMYDDPDFDFVMEQDRHDGF